MLIIVMFIITFLIFQSALTDCRLRLETAEYTAAKDARAVKEMQLHMRKMGVSLSDPSSSSGAASAVAGHHGGAAIAAPTPQGQSSALGTSRRRASIASGEESSSSTRKQQQQHQHQHGIRQISSRNSTVTAMSGSSSKQSPIVMSQDIIDDHDQMIHPASPQDRDRDRDADAVSSNLQQQRRLRSDASLMHRRRASALQ